MDKPKAGQEVYVVEQSQRYGGPGRRYHAKIVRVGTKNAYIERHGKEAGFDWGTGKSKHSDNNARANGFGFDAYESQADLARVERENTERKRLDLRLVKLRGWGLIDMPFECVEKIHAVLDEFQIEKGN